jgi:hypothetical protein
MYVAGQQASPAPDALGLKLSLVREVVRFDEPIDLELTYINIGNDPIEVARTYTIGRDAIDIVARSGDCEYEASGLIADIKSTVRPFLLTPLLAYERFTQTLIRLNDIASLGGSDLILPHEGKYSVQATFTSQGNQGPAPIQRVWRGSVTSDPISLIVLPPRPGNVERMRALLEEGVRTGTADPVSVTYFRYVRDEGAAGVLVKLIERGVFDPWLAHAVAHQGRPQDAPALEKFSERISRTDRDLAAYALGLAKHLREPGRCDR